MPADFFFLFFEPIEPVDTVSRRAGDLAECFQQTPKILSQIGRILPIELGLAPTSYLLKTSVAGVHARTVQQLLGRRI